MKISLGKLAIEVVSAGALLGWAVWVTMGIFTSEKVQAVQQTQYQYIVDSLKDIKEGLGITKK